MLKLVTTGRVRSVRCSGVNGVSTSSKKKPDLLTEIEETQVALRASIEQSRELVEKSQELLDKHRRELESRH